MEKTQTNLSKVSNLIFSTIITFVLAFVWTNFYLSNYKTALISAIIISIAEIIIYLVIKHFQRILTNKKHDSIQKLENLRVQLMYSENNEILKTLSTPFKLSNLTQLTSNHYIDAENGQDVYLFFDKIQLSEEDVIYAYKNSYFKNIIIFCIIKKIQILELEDHTLKVIDLENINKKLFETKTEFNTKIKIKKTPKLRAKDLLRIILSKDKSKKYFSFGSLLLISSIFTPYYIYYIIIGTSLLLVSLYARFNKTYN